MLVVARGGLGIGGWWMGGVLGGLVEGTLYWHFFAFRMSEGSQIGVGTKVDLFALAQHH